MTEPVGENFKCAYGVIMTQDERTVWNTTFAIHFARLTGDYHVPEIAATLAAMKADSAIVELRKEMAKRNSA